MKYSGLIAVLWLAAIHLAQAQSDVGSYTIQKIIEYGQSGPSTVTLGSPHPYEFIVAIEPGSSGTFFTSAAVTPPTGGTGSVSFLTGPWGGSTNPDSLSFEEQFTSKAAMDSAFPSGTGVYNFSIHTTAPNSYSDQISFGADNYPANPQITSVTNATWIGGYLVITDITQPVTITWNNPGGAGAGITIGNFSGSGPSSYTLPANSLSNNSFYSGEIFWTAGGGAGSTNSNTVPGALSNVLFSAAINFTIQTGTPSGQTSTYLVGKEHVLVQTANSTPVDGTGGPLDFEYAPYNLRIQCPVSGTVTGPSSTSFPLSSAPGAGYSSGPLASLSALNSAAPDGIYNFPGGVQVSLAGDGYPAAPQIISVNGATPVWDAQGHLVLDPTLDNTVAWSSITVPNFATNGQETASFFAFGGSFNTISQKAGVTQSSSTPFTSLTIPANTMTPGDNYGGKMKYFEFPTFSNPSTNVYDEAEYETATEFYAVAKPLSGLLQTINFPAIADQTVGAAAFTLTATATSALPVSYSVVSGPATLSGTNNHTVTVTGIGTVVIKASQAGNSTYAAAADVTQSFNVGYSFGAEVQSIASASMTYNASTESFQYTDAPISATDDNAYLPLTGAAASLITTSSGWSVSLNVNLAARSMTSTGNVNDTGSGSPLDDLGLGVICTNSANGFNGVAMRLSQFNNAGGTGDYEFANDQFGTAAQFVGQVNGNSANTTPLGSSSSYNGHSYLPLSGSSANSPATESISAVSGVVTLSYSTTTNTLTGYYNGTPVGSYSLAGVGSNASLTLIVTGASEGGNNVSAGTVTANNFSVSTDLALSQWEAQYPALTDLVPTDAPQKDGVATLLKYLYDINPGRPMTAADRAALPLFGVTAGGDLTMTFREYALQTGITMNVQTSTDLQNWTTVSKAANPTAGSYTLQPTGVIDANTGDPYMKIDYQPTGSPAREFLRLQVTQP